MMMSRCKMFLYSAKVPTSMPQTVKDSSIFSRNVMRRALTAGSSSLSLSLVHFRRTCTCCDVVTSHKVGSAVSQSIYDTSCQYDWIPIYVSYYLPYPFHAITGDSYLELLLWMIHLIVGVHCELLRMLITTDKDQSKIIICCWIYWN